jgi:hypothetical protein
MASWLFAGILASMLPSRLLPETVAIWLYEIQSATYDGRRAALICPTTHGVGYGLVTRRQFFGSRLGAQKPRSTCVGSRKMRGAELTGKGTAGLMP